MNAKVELEISKNELSDELENLVREIAEQEIIKLVNKKANELVKNEIDKILQPLVLSVLTENKFDFETGYHSYLDKRKLDDKLKSMVVSYLDNPNYLYSRTSVKPSERYKPGQGKPLLNHLVEDRIVAYIDEEFIPKIKPIVDNFLNEKKELEEFLKNKTKELLLNSMS